MGVYEVLLVVGILAVALPLFGFWIWALVDCLKNETSDNNEKLLWTLLIIFTEVIGAAIYYFVRRPQRMAALGR